MMLSDTVTKEGVASSPSSVRSILDTGHLQGAVKTRAISGGVVSAAGQGTQLVLTVIYNAILARLLSPLDFGLVAIVNALAGFLQVFKDAGLSTATVQRENITHAQVSNLFWINVAVSGVAALVMIVSAPLVALTFHEHELAGISVALSAAFIFDGLAVQHVALLNRQMRFEIVTGIEVLCTAAGFSVGVVMALTGWRYWSLIGALLSTGLLRVGTIWALTGWRPQWPNRNSGTKPLVKFGADLTMVGVITALARSSDSLLIGRFIGSEAVGLYSRATALLTRPMERLIAPIYAVIIPTLSRLQAEPERYRRAFFQVFEGLAIMGIVFTGLFFPLSDAVVRVVLGVRWLAATPIFAALTLAATFIPLSTATSWLYTSQGRGRDLLVTASLQAIAVVGSFVVGLRFGVGGVAISYSCSGLITLPLTFYIAGRKGPVATSDLWWACLRHVPVLLAVFGATWVAERVIGRSLSAPVQLLLCIPAGVLAGGLAVVLCPAPRTTVLLLVRQLSSLSGLRSRQS